MNDVYKRMDEVHASRCTTEATPRNLPNRREENQPIQEMADEEVDYYSYDGHSSIESLRRPRCTREDKDQSDDNLGGIKLKISSFQ